MSVVYGLPVCESLERKIKEIQINVEEKIPDEYIWYEPERFHITLIRGKSSTLRLSLMNEHILDTVIQKISSCPNFNLQLKNAQVYQDGHIRIPCQARNLFPFLMEEHLVDVEKKTKICWRRTPDSWVSIGYLKNVSEEKFSLECLWNSSSMILSKLKSKNPLQITVDNVKLVHFSNISFNPIDKQRWIEIPLNSGSISNFDINQLGIPICEHY